MSKDEVEALCADIESLQAEMADIVEQAKSVSPELTVVQGGRAEEPEDNDEQEKKEEVTAMGNATGASILDAAIEADEAERHVEDIDSGGSASADQDAGTLTMTLQGKMKLRLNYAFNEQSVTVCFTDECLLITMHDGVEFKVPFKRN